jgi:hypothetical protein
LFVFYSRDAPDAISLVPFRDIYRTNGNLDLYVIKQGFAYENTYDRTVTWQSSKQPKSTPNKAAGGWRSAGMQ